MVRLDEPGYLRDAITAAVVRSGFKSKNKTLSTSVGIALAEISGVRRVSRGVYGLW